MRRVTAWVLLVASFLGACSTSPADRSVDDASTAPVESPPRPTAPSVPSGPLSDDLADDLGSLARSVGVGLGLDRSTIGRVGDSGDARVAWLVADLLRFTQGGPDADALVAAFESLTDVSIDDPFAWGAISDLLIAWDLPAAPGYVDRKAEIYLAVEPGWRPFFEDRSAAIDWRLITWGGVLIDDRPIDATDGPCPEGCIPALDDPAVTDADGGDWYPDEALVFGVTVDGESRAYPKNVMEVHEMVNDTLGGRRIAMPYCTLCLSAQVYFTDGVDPQAETPGTYELRTSGLLSRSNKVMFEFHTRSAFDTFTGVAVSGPLLDLGVALPQHSVTTSTWGEWKDAHPTTTIVAEDGGIGREYPLDPLGGRDDDGPIFPIGDTDPRLGVQERVLGVETPDGSTVAFPVVELRSATGPIVFEDVRVVPDAGGFRAETRAGTPLVSHEAFWFAWSQFFPDTGLWRPNA